MLNKMKLSPAVFTYPLPSASRWQPSQQCPVHNIEAAVCGKNRAKPRHFSHDQTSFPDKLSSPLFPLLQLLRPRRWVMEEEHHTDCTPFRYHRVLHILKK